MLVAEGAGVGSFCYLSLYLLRFLGVRCSMVPHAATQVRMMSECKTPLPPPVPALFSMCAVSPVMMLFSLSNHFLLLASLRLLINKVPSELKSRASIAAVKMQRRLLTEECRTPDK